MLRKLKAADKKYFTRWWRDKELLKLTSGFLRPITDIEVDRYFSNMLKTKTDYHYMITTRARVIGHISLVKRKNGWFETQIVIGEKKYWGRGYGTRGILSLIRKAKRLHISKIYLEVRPNNMRAINAYKSAGFVAIGIKRYPKNKQLPQVLRMKNTLK
jgi:RimJ/RimL family protein N-acetyltransferase